jgi:hypothetical protein
MKWVAIALMVLLASCTDQSNSSKKVQPMVIPAADVQTPLPVPQLPVQQAAELPLVTPAYPHVPAVMLTLPEDEPATPAIQKVCIESGKCRELVIHKKFKGTHVPK